MMASWFFGVGLLLLMILLVGLVSISLFCLWSVLELKNQKRRRGPRGHTGSTGPNHVTGGTGTLDAVQHTKLTFNNAQQANTGPMGPIGPNGHSGSRGSTGATGIAGVNGAAGVVGAQGVPGLMGPTGLEGFSIDMTGSTGGGLLVISAFDTIYLPPGATGQPGQNAIAQMSWSSGSLTGGTFMNFGDDPTETEHLGSIVMAAPGRTLCLFASLDDAASTSALTDGWEFLLNLNGSLLVGTQVLGGSSSGNNCFSVPYAAGDLFSVAISPVGTTFNPDVNATVSLSYQS